MRFASLGSGSRGNSLVVEAANTRLLLDCGFGLQETRLRLARLGLQPDDLTGIVVTHEHGDHVAGVFKLARRWNLPVWLSEGTLAALGDDRVKDVDCRTIRGDEPFAVADIEVCPFPVPHDAREPLQFVFRDGARALGVLTDVGTATAHIVSMLSGCDALVLECNHDPGMLAASRYPDSLKRRISGRFGHLANCASAELLSRLDKRRLQHLVAAHLSEKNNRPEFVLDALSNALGCEPDWIGIATQDFGSGWREITS